MSLDDNQKRFCPCCLSVFDDVYSRCPEDGRELERIVHRRYLGEKILARYQLIGMLGEGGWSEVYDGYDSQLSRWVAVKVLFAHHSWSSDSLARFQREAQATARLRHKNIVAIYDHGFLADGSPYMIMEKVSGITLERLLVKKGFLSWQESLRLAIDLCEGLGAAHQSDIIHRDIKPGNVLISEGNQSAKIADFGLARYSPDARTQNLTQTGFAVGTPSYMSPEQCQGTASDNRSDIYSLGCLLFELVCGEPPFSAGAPIELMLKHVNEKAPLASAKSRQSLPANLDKVISRTLEKKPERRYESMEELQEDLRAVLQNKEIKSSSAGKAEAVCKRRQERRSRKQWLTGASVVFIVVGMFLLGGLVWQVSRQGNMRSANRHDEAAFAPILKGGVYNPVYPPGFAGLKPGQKQLMKAQLPIYGVFRDVTSELNALHYRQYFYKGKIILAGREIDFTARESLDADNNLASAGIEYGPEIAASFASFADDVRLVEHIKSVEIEHLASGLIESRIHCSNGTELLTLVREDGQIEASASMGGGRRGKLVPSQDQSALAVINTLGNVVLSLPFKAAGDFSEGLLAVFDGKQWGYIEKSGAIAIAPQYKLAGPFKNGLARASLDGKHFGYIDRKGVFAIEARYSSAGDFLDGIAAVELNGSRQFIDRNGRRLPPASGDWQADRSLPDLLPAPHPPGWDYLDRSGHFVSNLHFDFADLFHGQLAVVSKGEKWCYVNRSGQLALSPKLSVARPVKDRMALVQKHGRWGYINDEGRYISYRLIDWGGDFSDGLAPVTIDRHSTYITRQWQEIVPRSYFIPSEFSEQLAAVCKYNRWGYINTAGRLVIPQKFLEAGPFQEGLARVRLLPAGGQVQYHLQ